MSEQESECEECIPGLPPYMGTFADLMALLMCFFVLLLTFAEMDVMKFKRLAGSMKQAFGVQNQIDANDVPKGTSIIAQEFSPGKPDPTPLQMIMQETVDADFDTLEVMCEAKIETAVANACGEDVSDAENKKSQISEFVSRKIEQINEKVESQAVEVAAKLQQEVAKDMVEIETVGRKIVIRVQEKGAFASGSAEMQPDFYPVLDKLISILKEIPGHIAIEGHTDNVPIKTFKFPSNWDLSVARALEVGHGLFDDGQLDQRRFSIKGMADTQPLVPNSSPENRTKNRRVEIVLQEQTDDELKKQLKEEITTIDAKKEDLDRMFDLDPDEIF